MSISTTVCTCAYMCVCVKQIDRVHQSAVHFLANGCDPGGTLGAHTITLGHSTAPTCGVLALPQVNLPALALRA